MGAMGKPKRFRTPDEKEAFVRRVEANINRGMNVTRAARAAGGTDQSYRVWKKEFAAKPMVPITIVVGKPAEA